MDVPHLTSWYQKKAWRKCCSSDDDWFVWMDPIIFLTWGNIFLVASLERKKQKEFQCKHSGEVEPVTGVYSVVITPRVIPQRTRDFKWQLSARVSQNLRSSSLSHVIAVTMFQRPIVNLSPLATAGRLHRSCSIGSEQAACYCILAAEVPFTDLSAHHFVHCPPLITLVYVSYCRYVHVWSRRFCVITWITRWSAGLREKQEKLDCVRQNKWWREMKYSTQLTKRPIWVGV